MFEHYIQNNAQYPGNTSLLEEINSNMCKVASQTKEKLRELSDHELPKKHDVEEMHEKHIQKALKEEIKSLKKCLKDHEAIHMENSQKLNLLQDNIHHQNTVLFSVFVGFIVAILVLCLIYNIPVIVAFLVTSISLYIFTTGYDTVLSLLTWLFY